MEGKFDLSNRVFYAVAILMLGILVYLAGHMIYEQKTLDNSGYNQVTVTGEGKVYVKPDVASVSLGVKIDGQDIGKITEDNVKKVNAIVADMKALGIDEKDIQTTQYSVTPQYNWTQDRGTVPNGYSIEQSISVKIRDFSKIGEVLSKASASGANTIGSLQFVVDDMEKVKQEARANAIAQARENAESMAKSSGISLGKIISIYENYYPSPMMYDKAVGVGMGMGGEMAVAPTIQPGQNEVTVTVNITYKIK